MLRPATDADWPHAWSIQREAFQDLVTRTWGGWSEEQVRKCAEAWDPTYTRMIVVDVEVVGWVHVEHHPDHDWLDLLVVTPDRQGTGTGSCVLRRLVEEAAARRVPLWLSVYRTNRARRLYLKLGFAELDRDEVRVFMVYPASTSLVAPR